MAKKDKTLTYKLSKKQRKWANENAERLAESIGEWHSLGCPAFDRGGMLKCNCKLAETICTLQERSNYEVGILPRKPRRYIHDELDTDLPRNGL